MRRLVTLLIALIACVLPSAANAASVQRVGGVLRYKAAAHEFINGRVLETGTGSYLFRMRKGARQVLHARAGSGCRLDQARELRCSGNGIERIEMRVGGSQAAIFRIDAVRVPVSYSGSFGTDLVLVATTRQATVFMGPGRDSLQLAGVDGGEYHLNGGGGSDILDFGSRVYPGNLSTPASARVSADGGDGDDHLNGGPGADALVGGPGNDLIAGGGGADTISGGSGIDTVQFTHAYGDTTPLSVTLDGQRNDGSPGQDALVGADVENAAIIGYVLTDDQLVGDDGPNTLEGGGSVEGLGGDDTLVTDNPTGAARLDGGEGDDRLGAWMTLTPEGASAAQASAVCGSGSDVVFTGAAPAPDCEFANVGMHIVRASKIDRRGRFKVRVDCTDPRPCRLGRVIVRLDGHLVGLISGHTPDITIPTGGSVVTTAQLRASIWVNHRRDRSLRLNLTPQPHRLSQSAAQSTGSFPRDLVVAIANAR